MVDHELVVELIRFRLIGQLAALLAFDQISKDFGRQNS